MAALRIHQHGVDDERIALPFPPQAFGPARQIGRVAALDHHALDRLGIVAGAGRCRIGARAARARPSRERDERREVDARRREPRDEGFQPPAPLRERPLAQILAALDQEVVGAQMRGKLGEQLRRNGFAVQPLLQHVEATAPGPRA